MIQDAPVGGRGTCQCDRRASQAWISAVLWVASLSITTGTSSPFGMVRSAWAGRIGGSGWEQPGAIERLEPALLVDAQDDRALGRRHVKADDVADLVDEQGVGGQLEGLSPARLEREGLPDAVARSGGW